MISDKMVGLVNNSSVIRAMFEEGILTKGIDRFALNWTEFISVYEKIKRFLLIILQEALLMCP